MSGPPPASGLRPVTARELWLTSSSASWLYPVLWRAVRRGGTANFSDDSRVLRPHLKGIKLTKRFIQGGHFGYLIAGYLLGEKISIPTRVRISQLFGWWFVTIIAIDYSLDWAPVPAEVAKQFLERCLKAIHGRGVELGSPLELNRTADCLTSRVTQQKIPAVLERLTLTLCTALRRALGRWLSDGCGASGAKIPTDEEFVRRSAALMAGQLSSNFQFCLAPELNWRWYFRDAITKKGNNGFLAPLTLFDVSAEASAKREILERSFTNLNSVYLHWQLIDDVADIRPDTQAGLINAVGYILLSQGYLAEAVRQFPSTDVWSAIMSRHVPEDMILRLIRESGLLDEIYRSTHESCEDGQTQLPRAKCWDLLARGHAGTLLRAALANQSQDEAVALGELIERRIAQKDIFSRSFLSGDTTTSLKVLSESMASNRILHITKQKKRVERYSRELALIRDIKLLCLLRTIDIAMSRTYRAAARVNERMRVRTS